MLPVTSSVCWQQQRWWLLSLCLSPMHRQLHCAAVSQAAPLDLVAVTFLKSPILQPPCSRKAGRQHDSCRIFFSLFLHQRRGICTLLGLPPRNAVILGGIQHLCGLPKGPVPTARRAYLRHVRLHSGSVSQTFHF